MRFNIHFVTIVFLLHLVLYELATSKKGRRRNKKVPREDLGDTFTCPSCNRIHCPVKNPRNLGCEGGTTTDVCDCCTVCAKLEGQDCGGRDGYLGRCDKGLLCKEDRTSTHLSPKIFLPSIDGMSHQPQGDQSRGICTAVTEVTIEADPELSCKPECTSDFCLSNPKAICSARNNAMESQDCQGKCQHTACSACFFQEEPPCPKCTNNDFECIKKFAKCARKKSTCTRNKYPCKKLKKPPTGKIVCWVPKCL